MEHIARTYDLYSLKNYQFTEKEAQPEKDATVEERLARLRKNYRHFGGKRTVEAILMVHNFGHPHVLLLQIGNTFCKLWVNMSCIPFDF
jgi:cleavage and polyadenylation specificity factor subunit 5